jgi:hypothetical protein
VQQSISLSMSIVCEKVCHVAITYVKYETWSETNSGIGMFWCPLWMHASVCKYWRILYNWNYTLKAKGNKKPLKIYQVKQTKYSLWKWNNLSYLRVCQIYEIKFWFLAVQHNKHRLFFGCIWKEKKNGILKPLFHSLWCNKSKSNSTWLLYID